MWSDGTIDLVPSQDAMWVYVPEVRMWKRVFKGEAGVPPGAVPWPKYAARDRFNTYHFEEGKP
jgi:hypothetical protein